MSGATVELHRSSGQDGGTVHVAEAPMPGGPETPLDRAAVSTKIRTCLAVGGLDADVETDRIWDFVDGVADLDASGLRRALSEFTPSRQPVA